VLKNAVILVVLTVKKWQSVSIRRSHPHKTVPLLLESGNVTRLDHPLQACAVEGLGLTTSTSCGHGSPFSSLASSL